MVARWVWVGVGVWTLLCVDHGTTRLFDVHVLSMSFAFCVMMPLATTAFHVCETVLGLTHTTARRTHATCMVCAACATGVGFTSIFSAHSASHLQSPHSVVGSLVLLATTGQVVAASVGIHVPTEVFQWHRHIGRAVVVAGQCVVVSGLTLYAGRHAIPDGAWARHVGATCLCLLQTAAMVSSTSAPRNAHVLV